MDANRHRIAASDRIIIFRREIADIVKGGDRRFLIGDVLDIGLNVGPFAKIEPDGRIEVEGRRHARLGP